MVLTDTLLGVGMTTGSRQALIRVLVCNVFDG